MKFEVDIGKTTSPLLFIKNTYKKLLFEHGLKIMPKIMHTLENKVHKGSETDK